MERATKLFVTVWALGALGFALWLLSPAFNGLILLTLTTLATMAVFSAISKRSVGLVLVLAYVYPVVIFVLFDRYHRDFDVLWFGALLGAVLPDAVRTPWRLPGRWRAPLVLWALTVATAATIVIGREMDFYPALLFERGMINSLSGGGGPTFLSRWILAVALSQIIGILWFDWLFGAGLDFQRDIATPLIVSVSMLAAVSIYQLFVDSRFLSTTQFLELGRATGTLLDANPSGMIAAFWIGGAIVWSWRLPRWRVPALVITLTATWLAVWATGSRTAFGAGLLSTGAGMYALRGHWMGESFRSQPWRLLFAAAAAVGVVWLLSLAQPEVVGPLRRFWNTLPGASLQSVRDFAWELWNRNGYGTVALAMIRGFPLFGVGIGCFHLMVGDFTTAPLIADNAQNWYRHQIAELGLIGSLGSLAWVAAFAWFVVRRRAAEPAVASVVRAMLVGFGFISLFGMPAQSPAVSFTFWTVAFWYVSLVGAPPAARISARGWAVLLIVAAVFAVGTARQAATELRVASRAQRVGFPYSYGFHYPEPDAAGGEFRWAKQRAAVVLDAPMRVLIVSVWVSHQDMAANPVEVKVWRDGDLAIDTTLRDGSRATTAALLPADQRRVVLDTWVSRAVRPSDFGVADARELGLMVKWEFAAQLPRGYESAPATR